MDGKNKKFLDVFRRKLNSEEAETLAELLVSVLVTALGLTMFAAALMSAQQIIVRGEGKLSAYYTARNELESEEHGKEAVLILEEAGQRTAIGFSPDVRMRGCYPVELFSDSEDLLKLYRYSRLERVE